MKKPSSTYYLTIGLILFPLGLLMLLGQPSIVNLFSNIMPSTQTIEIFALIIQFIGEGLICYGIIRAISDRVKTQTEYNNQVMMSGFYKNMQEQTALVTGFKRNMEEQVIQMNNRLDLIQRNQNLPSSVKVPSECKFCGSKIKQGSFCPECGKAQT